MSRRPESESSSVDDTMHWAGRDDESTRDLTGKTLGDFQVERLLGRGGMGEVYLARQVSLNRPVALKVLLAELLKKPTYLSRFEAEATAVAKLNHPNIVHVYTLGMVDGIRFIAMEYVQGTNLREYIRKKGAVDFPLALSIMKQSALAVAAAGEIGLIHRDIKPENLLLTKKGQVKVADFGLCRDLDSEHVNLTQSGITMGTPTYMSPEQAQGFQLDHRSDLYSLGVTFYHMLTGVTPFQADSPLAMALKHVKDTPPSMTVFRADIPQELDRLVLKLMAKDPKARYQSAGEMLRDLAKVREVLNAPSGLQTVEMVGSSTTSPALPATPSTPPPVKERPAATQVATASGTGIGSGAGTKFLSPDAIDPGVSLMVRSVLIVIGLVLGGVFGWLSRTPDLLAGDVPEAPRSMPGLWIAPGWEGIEKAASAEEQYHYAQIRAPREMQESAWLAVPGHFSGSRDWASRAYIQLARLLVERHDAERLAVFADEIEHWRGAQTHDKALASIARTGVKAIDGDLDGVIADLGKNDFARNLTDPALLSLCLEVTMEAERNASRRGSPPNLLTKQNLDRILADLVSRLLVSEFRLPWFPPGRPIGAS